MLDMLNDGRWHLLDEIQEEIQLDKDQTKQVIEFLKRYNFLMVDNVEKKIKLENEVQKFLDETATS
jgi:vacuolar-type H+-ATPase subunit I/STV1